MTSPGGPLVRPGRRSVAVGTFDGVHLGHAQVIAGCDTVLTFDPHPRSVLQPGDGPRLLTDAAGKRRRLAALGVREMVVIPFDREWAAMDAAAFVNEVLVQRLDAATVSVGADFRFGARGVGEARMLQADPRFVTNVAQLMTIEGSAVSSSRVRRLVAAGEVEQAARLLGRPHTLPATVREDGRLVIDSALAIPGPGRYSATIGVEVTRLSVCEDGFIEAARRWPGAGDSVEVSFSCRI